MKMQNKILSFVLTVLMMCTSVHGQVPTANEGAVVVTSSEAQIEGINHKTNLCSSDMEAAEAVIEAVADGNETVHKYSVRKTNNNIQQLYRTEGLTGTTHVASYDIRFDEIYLDENLKTTTETVVAFRGFDDSGAGSGKDYNPYIEAVKATKNGDNAAILTTVNGDTLDYNKWYTFYMTIRIDGANRYSSLYYKERDTLGAVRYVNQSADTYARDGVLSYVYVYVLSKTFSAEKTSVFCVDNISFRNQEMIFADDSSIAKVYGPDGKVTADLYIAPGFKSARAYIDETYTEIYPTVSGKYSINAALSSFETGEHNFKVVAVYGNGDSENTIVYEKPFAIKENMANISSESELFSNGVFYSGKNAPFSAIPAGATQDSDGTATKIALSDTALSGTEYIKLPFYSSGTSYYNAASAGKVHAISFDMKLSGIVGASTSQKDLMQVRGLKNGAWTGGTYKLMVSQKDGKTIINGLGNDYEIKQNVWYTYTFVTNPSNATYNVYCVEKGRNDVALLGTVTDADTASINCLALGLLKGNCSIQTGNGTTERVAPDIYLDNLYIREALKTEGRNISDKVYTSSDTFGVTAYIAPGFDSAEVVFDDEHCAVVDNGFGVYRIEKSFPDVDVLGDVEFKIVASYGDNVITTTETIDVYAKTAYVVHKDANGGDMYYPVDDAVSTDGVFPCMTVEKNGDAYVAQYSLDVGRGGSGKSLKATYTAANESKFCNFGYIGGNAATIGNDRYTKISMDVKFSAKEFKVKVQNKFNNAWPSPGSSKEFINKYGIVQIEDKDTFYYDTNRWYSMSYVVDTVKGEGKIYLDGEYICTNTLGLGTDENPTQLQFCISHKSATAENPAYLWVDNLKIETSPYSFEGINGAEYEKVSADVESLTVVPVSNPGSGINVVAQYSDETSAGDVTVDESTGTATFNANSKFNASRDIIIKYTDASDGKVLAKKTFAFVGENGMAIYDPQISAVSDRVEATVYADGGNNGRKATLLLVSYKDSDKKQLAAVAVEDILPCESRTSYTASLPGDSGNEFSAFVWSDNKLVPLKKNVNFSK